MFKQEDSKAPSVSRKHSRQELLDQLFCYPSVSNMEELKAIPSSAFASAILDSEKKAQLFKWAATVLRKRCFSLLLHPAPCGFWFAVSDYELTRAKAADRREASTDSPSVPLGPRCEKKREKRSSAPLKPSHGELRDQTFCYPSPLNMEELKGIATSAFSMNLPGSEKEKLHRWAATVIRKGHFGLVLHPPPSGFWFAVSDYRFEDSKATKRREASTDAPSVPRQPKGEKKHGKRSHPAQKNGKRQADAVPRLAASVLRPVAVRSRDEDLAIWHDEKLNEAIAASLVECRSKQECRFKEFDALLNGKGAESTDSIL